ARSTPAAHLPELHTSTRPTRPTRPYTCSTPAAHLQTSVEATSPRPQHASRAPDLQISSVYTLAPDLQSGRAPYLYPSPFTRLQRASRAPELHSSTPTRPQRASKLPSSILLCLYVCTPAACLQSSRTPYLSTSISTYLYRASRAPFLYAYTPAARLPSSRAPF